MTKVLKSAYLFDEINCALISLLTARICILVVLIICEVSLCYLCSSNLLITYLDCLYLNNGLNDTHAFKIIKTV